MTGTIQILAGTDVKKQRNAKLMEQSAVAVMLLEKVVEDLNGIATKLKRARDSSAQNAPQADAGNATLPANVIPLPVRRKPAKI